MSNVRILNESAVEIAENPDVIQFDSGLSASQDGEGKVTVIVEAGGISTEKLADASVTLAKRTSVQARTATADGLTTGIIDAATTFVSATSAGATNALTLPACTAGTIGRTIDIAVGANGYELLTGQSGDTINTVDTDGTNQLDVAANTLLRCVQVSATGWVAYQVAATTITVVAPDND